MNVYNEPLQFGPIDDIAAPRPEHHAIPLSAEDMWYAAEIVAKIGATALRGTTEATSNRIIHPLLGELKEPDQAFHGPLLSGHNASLFNEQLQLEPWIHSVGSEGGAPHDMAFELPADESLPRSVFKRNFGWEVTYASARNFPPSDEEIRQLCEHLPRPYYPFWV